MRPVPRRAFWAGGAAFVLGGTLTAVLALRKPAPPEVHVLNLTPEEQAPPLGGMDALKPTEPPRAPPDISFLDEKGATLGLAAFAGRGVVLNLWATWCVPCRAELPALAALNKRAAEAGFVVLPLSVDRGGAPVVTKYLAAHGLTDLPVYLDPKGKAAEALGARGLPTTIIIDRNGQERARLEGAADWGSSEALAAIRKLVG
jgi:thiol-disulfide isomerase/thioredoxin